MKNYLYYLFFLICLIFPIKSFTQTWIPITSVGGSDFFVKSPKAVYNSFPQIWDKEVNKILKYEKNGKEVTIYNGYLLELYEYDCLNSRSRILQLIYYNSKGEVLHSLNFANHMQNWNNIAPDSIGELFLKKACENYK